MQPTEAGALSELVGQSVRKDFPGHGVFDGKITSWDPATGWVCVTYPDGDTEELGVDEVRPLLVSTDEVSRERLPPALKSRLSQPYYWRGRTYTAQLRYHVTAAGANSCLFDALECSLGIYFEDDEAGLRDRVAVFVIEQWDRKAGWDSGHTVGDLARLSLGNLTATSDTYARHVRNPLSAGCKFEAAVVATLYGAHVICLNAHSGQPLYEYDCTGDWAPARKVGVAYRPAGDGGISLGTPAHYFPLRTTVSWADMVVPRGLQLQPAAQIDMSDAVWRCHSGWGVGYYFAKDGWCFGTIMHRRPKRDGAHVEVRFSLCHPRPLALSQSRPRFLLIYLGFACFCRLALSLSLSHILSVALVLSVFVMDWLSFSRPRNIWRLMRYCTCR
jgi:hypothetical protein